jgi:hypothetical protein
MFEVDSFKFDTDVFTLQLDLCRNLQLVYNHKKYLGSIVQAGIYGLEVKFNDYPELGFSSGYEELKKEYSFRSSGLAYLV